MGCDIHLFVERRENAESPWRPLLVEHACTGWWHERAPEERKGECYSCKGTGIEGGYNHRNYDAFAILANVRNGRGFAGVETGDGFEPISEPRGLPKDLSPELLAIHERDNGPPGDDIDYDAHDRSYEDAKRLYGRGSFGDHSFSWLTLRELNECDWSRVTHRSGVVGVAEARAFLEKGSPGSWCGGVNGRSVVHISNEAMFALVRGGYEPPKEHTAQSFYTRVRWPVTYAQAAGYFHSGFLPALRDHATSGPDNIRIVFGFDS